MNICLISNEYPPETGFGGIGTYTYNLGQGLSELGNTVTVITQAVKEEKVYKDKKVTVYRIRDKKIPVRGAARMANLLTGNGFSVFWHSYSVFKKINEIEKNRGRFDIIECPLWGGEGFSYSQKIGIPLIVRLETPVFKLREILGQDSSKLKEYFERKILNNSVFAIAISKNIGELIKLRYKIPDEKIKISYLGIKLPEIKKPLFKKNSYKLLYVGRLEKRKGTTEFIEAIPAILSGNSKISIDIVGKDIPQAPHDTNFQEYFNKIVAGKFKKSVKFHGFVTKKKLDNFYADCDIFIAPSRYESFGLIFLEAMVYGKPVIGTKTGAIPEIVKNGKTGLLISVNKPSEIADAVLKLFGDERLRQEMGRNAFDCARENFSAERLIKDTLKIYNQAIKKFNERR